MSTRILIIPEDFRKDQYMLKPLIEAMFSALGKPKAKIEICVYPLLTGVTQAMDRHRLTEIFEEYRGMVDLFLLCVDRDCREGRRVELNNLETWARETCGCTLIAENAWQELEVWVLAGHDLPQEWGWETIRAECDPKERYFMLFADQHKVSDTPGEGRKVLAEEAVHRYDRIKQLCPQDVGALEDHLRSWLNG